MKNFIKITSKDNSLIKLISALQTSSKERNKKNFCVLEGIRISSDAYDNGIRFDKLIISEEAQIKYGDIVRKFGDNADECFILPDSLFKKISDTDTPQGVITVLKKPQSIPEIKPNGRYIALENIQDPANLGAISRTAESLGADGILLSKNSCDPYSPKSLRASMGTVFRMPIILTDDLMADIKKAGLRSFACVVDKKAKPITDISFPGGSVVIIGNEGNGLTEKTVASADECITIPMKGKAESLNASVAASIAIWEMTK